PEGYSSLENYWDRNDLSWLETIDLSGNNLTDIVIDGGPYNTMPLKTVNLSNNPNLTSLSIVKCTQLETVDLTGTGITPEAFETIKADILESSPSANVIYTPNAVKPIEANAPFVNVQGKNIVVKNKNVNDVVMIFDLSGRKMIETSDNIINASSLGKGVFIVKINNFVSKIGL
ncbi:MAG TPA: T9SS type A sorting domain-containing protein, partial [Dysgonamonadaceae bacterium]|nr:T9SS type A sorting domain-containing protein [Dysgonamonadaceae bacterium]